MVGSITISLAVSACVCLQALCTHSFAMGCGFGPAMYYGVRWERGPFSFILRSVIQLKYSYTAILLYYTKSNSSSLTHTLYCPIKPIIWANKWDKISKCIAHLSALLNPCHLIFTMFKSISIIEFSLWITAENVEEKVALIRTVPKWIQCHVQTEARFVPS